MGVVFTRRHGEPTSSREGDSSNVDRIVKLLCLDTQEKGARNEGNRVLERRHGEMWKRGVRRMIKDYYKIWRRLEDVACGSSQSLFSRYLTPGPKAEPGETREEA